MRVLSGYFCEKFCSKFLNSYADAGFLASCGFRSKVLVWVIVKKILDPRSGIRHPGSGSRMQGVKKHRIPEHCRSHIIYLAWGLAKILKLYRYSKKPEYRNPEPRQNDTVPQHWFVNVRYTILYQAIVNLIKKYCKIPNVAFPLNTLFNVTVDDWRYNKWLFNFALFTPNYRSRSIFSFRSNIDYNKEKDLILFVKKTISLSVLIHIFLIKNLRQF
jgi:hypothetical protein